MAGWARGKLAGLVVVAACGVPEASGLFPPAATLHAEAHARFDPDGDGRITADEYAVFDPEPGVFRVMDTSGDGTVTAEELQAFVLARQPRALVSRRGMGPRVGTGTETPPGPGRPPGPPGSVPGAAPPPGSPWPPGPPQGQPPGAHVPPRAPPNVPLQAPAPAPSEPAPAGTPGSR